MKTCMPDRGFCTCKLGVRCQKHTLRPEVLSLVGFVPAGAPIFSMSCRIDSAPFQQQRITELALVLLCYKSHSRLPQQNGQQKSWERRVLANWTRNVAMECGLWRSARTRRAPRFELGRNFRGA